MRYSRPDRATPSHAIVARRLILALLVGWVAGIALQLRQAELWSSLAYVAGFVTALFGTATVGLTSLRRRRSGAAWVLALSLLGAFSYVGLHATRIASQALDPVLEGQSLVLAGTIESMPQRNQAGQRFRFQVESATHQGRPVRVPPLLQLAWYNSVSTRDETDGPTSGQPELKAGERWQFVAQLKAPRANLNPHGFDYELWLWEQGIRATGYIRTTARDAPPRLLQTSHGHWVERARQSVRGQILQRVGGEPETQTEQSRRFAGILAALVTGDQNVIERADWDIFRATGVAHLMSISGLHITMFAWLASRLIQALWRRTAYLGWRWCLWLPAPNAALIGGVAAAALYALFSGWGVPAQRTILMLSTFGCLRLLGLVWPWWLTWLLAAAIVLGFDPWALMQAGFWLSFVAVGVLFAADPGGGENQTRGVRALLAKTFKEQGVVTLALTPLSFLIFGEASVVGLPANLIAIPWVTLVITPLALGGTFLAPLWDAAAWALRPLAWLLEWFASWTFASVSMAAIPVWIGAAAVCGGIILSMRWPGPIRLAGLPLILPLLLWQPSRPDVGSFELLAADVGQGNAVLVRTARHTLLYDTGPRYSLESDAGNRVIVPLLRALGEKVDVLLLSHRDADHIGGARAVLSMQPGSVLMSSIEPAHPLHEIRPSMRCEAGQRWEWDEVLFEILHPMPDSYREAHKSNNMSCVLRLTSRSTGAVALLVGDIEAREELALVRRSPHLQADFLLVPHHGSKTSSTAAFLDAVRPRLGLVQAGYRNRFGHPAPEVMERYQRRRIGVIESSQCGAMRWHSDRPGHARCERDENARYWHHRMDAKRP